MNDILLLLFSIFMLIVIILLGIAAYRDRNTVENEYKQYNEAWREYLKRENKKS